MTLESKLTKHQTKSFGPRHIEGYGEGAALWVTLRYDDECGNGHNTFAITGHVTVPRRRDWVACGMVHDDITEVYPELAKYIKWHLCSSDGPMHYIANTVYLAGDKDCNGRRKGEPSSYELSVKFDGFPIHFKFPLEQKFLRWLADAEGSDFEVIRIDYEGRDGYKFGPKYTLGGAPDKWHECPFDTEQEALEFLAAMRLGYKVVKTPTAYSEGKERELDAARSSAIWPDATDEDLTAPGLEDRLNARLPKLLEEFKSAMEELGFEF